LSQFIKAPPAVELAGFVKAYRTGWLQRPVTAVQAFSLRLPRGHVLGLFGPNGSGKSTTLRALAGLLAPTAGGCRICGHPAGSDAARALVGYLPESPRFPVHQTGREFLTYCAGLSGLDPSGDERVGEVLVWSGLAGAADRRIATYSKGMAQRLGLAQAVVHRPQVVLLDEPVNGLDPEGRLALGRLVRDLATQGRAVIFSSHLLAQAETWCDRIALLAGGRLLAEGATVDLLGGTRVDCPQPSLLERLYLEKLRT
jgi:ABC-type multidrug transport system ATPase subunit